jgi:two-component system, LytTR family, sensor kinase
MFEFLKKQSIFSKIEFWAFTALFAFGMFFFITDGADGENAADAARAKALFDKAGVPFFFYKNFFIPMLIHHIVVFIGFLALNFIIIPRLVKRQSFLKNLLLALGIYVVASLIFAALNTQLLAHRYPNSNVNDVESYMFLEGFSYTFALYAVLTVYSLIKYVGIYLLAKTEVVHRRFPFITREAIVATTIWLIMLLIFLIAEAEREVTITWAVLIPYGILFYSLAFQILIPRALAKRIPLLSYIFWSILIVAAAFLPILFLLLATTTEEIAFSISGFNTLFQLFLTVPLAWLIYKRREKGNEEVRVLKKELRQSNASIDFLRSQINPHFLFNALNTLYGTAIQENADRTSEGIQKLGDMMRFMLQENMQEKISLSREIDYLENYIALQRLRTDTNPIVQIQTDIQSKPTVYQIAPMLLIPFVENAFKHGISFREPSHIKVALDIKENTLYFDVHNSKHMRNGSGIDPEKGKSGIGLENVKQRLKLMYPNRHELIIRETTREFYVHLTIQLS